MRFVKVHNLDRNVDEYVNADHISRIRDLQSQSRDQKKCSVTFASGDTLTALGTSLEVIAMLSGADGASGERGTFAEGRDQ